jgi:hypothetical protein
MTTLNNVRCAQEAEFRHGDRNGCLKGTRGAVISKIELWANDTGTPPVYWLNGLAGTGKTTIAQSIAERFFSDGQLGASFFCSRNFEDRSNLKFIFPTLAVQLARRYTEFRPIFVSLVQSDPGIVHESLYNQADKLIFQPLKESSISTVIIIDALDECKDEEPASAILSVLGRFVSEFPSIKFFLTGRPEPRIREGFRLHLLASATDVFVLHDVSPEHLESHEANNEPTADDATHPQESTLVDETGESEKEDPIATPTRKKQPRRRWGKKKKGSAPADNDEPEGETETDVAEEGPTKIQPIISTPVTAVTPSPPALIVSEEVLGMF